METLCRRYTSGNQFLRVAGVNCAATIDVPSLSPSTVIVSVLPMTGGPPLKVTFVIRFTLVEFVFCTSSKEKSAKPFSLAGVPS